MVGEQRFMAENFGLCWHNVLRFFGIHLDGWRMPEACFSLRLGCGQRYREMRILQLIVGGW
jgi:hypothetical protein